MVREFASNVERRFCFALSSFSGDLTFSLILQNSRNFKTRIIPSLLKFGRYLIPIFICANVNSYHHNHRQSRNLPLLLPLPSLSINSYQDLKSALDRILLGLLPHSPDVNSAYLNVAVTASHVAYKRFVEAFWSINYKYKVSWECAVAY
jgi:hypothetical protein